MKRVLACLLVCVLLCPMMASASNAVEVKINGEPIKFDVPAQIINDRTMVPMRKIFESLSAAVEWFGDIQTIMATQNTNIIVMVIGDPNLFICDLITGEERVIPLEVPPMIVGDRTLVPVRAISESLGMKVDWDDVTRTVLITE